MKKFYNLMEAVSYHTHCCMCKERLSHYPLALVGGSDKTIYRWNLSDNIDSDTDDFIMVDAHSNHVEYLQESRKSIRYPISGIDDYSGQTPITFPTYSPKIKLKGIIYESIHLNCGNCHQFSYTIQIVVDISTMMLGNIQLNSEFVCYEEPDGSVHEIRNAYPFGETIYTNFEQMVAKSPYLPVKSPYDRFTIPLIPINFNDPKETVARIKKLVVFS